MYIRTKDGVYDTSKGLYTPSIKMWAIGTVTIYDEQIIRKSENLEELCDEFVIDNWKEKVKPVYCFKYVKETNSAYCIDETGYLILYLPQMLECGCIIKGAIWTDKGLIYVAKMNESGELKLI